MFKISKINPIRWSIDDELREHIIYIGETLYVSEKFLTEHFPDEIIEYQENKNDFTSAIYLRSKKWIAVLNIENYRCFQKLFYLKLWKKGEDIGAVRSSILSDRQMHKLIISSCAHSQDLEYFNIFIASYLLKLIECDDSYSTDLNTGDGMVYMMKEDIESLTKMSGISSSKYDFHKTEIKVDFVSRFQKEILSIKEIIDNDKQSQEVCSTKILFDYFLGLSKTSLIEKFLIYYNFFRSKKITHEFYPCFNTNCFESFKNKYYKYKREGISSLVHGNFRNKHAKINIDRKDYQQIKKLYSNGKKWSYRTITKELNTARALDGKKPISKQTIINIIKNDIDYLTMHLIRYGSEELDNFLPHPRRLKPSSIFSVIQMDAARINILTRDTTGKLTFFYLVVAFDVHSGKIIGHRIVGFETFEPYFQILKELVESHYVYPQEIVLDNLRSLNSNVATRFFEKMNALGIKIRFHQKNNPQDKAQVENWFRIFNKLYLKNIDGFLGDGIKSKDKDSHPNIDLIRKYREPKNSMPEKDLRKIVDEQISLYNSGYRPSGEKKTPDMLFEYGYMDIKNEGYSPDREDVHRFLFYDQSKIFINKSYITLTVDGKINEYMFYDSNYEFVKKYFNKYLFMRYDKSDPSTIYLYEHKSDIRSIIVLRRYEKVPMAAHEMTHKDQRNAQIHSSEMKKLKTTINDDIKEMRKLITEFDVKKARKRSENEIGELRLEKIPSVLLNEKLDSKELIKNSLENEIEDVDNLDVLKLLTSMKSMFRMKGSNNLIN